MKRLKCLIVLLVAVIGASSLHAQIRATTESGNKVLLFDDGTWKYEEKKVESAAATTLATKTVVTPEPAINLEIDAAKEVQTEPEIVFYTQSRRLVRYFGEEKGRIRCKLSCSNTLGQIRLYYAWDVMVGDGERYFGYLKAGTKMTLHLLDGQKVELFVDENSKVNSSEKYNFTKISGRTQELSKAQLLALSSQPVLKIEMAWKKKTEDYAFENPNYFMETLPKVF